ncbi:NADPH-dependent FMN reductase [Caenimonas koreensis DSM 17982]|uniref:NADPH-dependent FMN reductase n=1 Tax=Caenimonas koreensis DSM 17982 TaxID=1121255 RepID=A0A844BC01_9BURK|nr:NADPH-dependent FMN reductase [Caenimonas koreensis]MRD48977.1 NADPH-dependent FMN reductase [Caenimonas koreensis DSM 17982]
MKVLGICGSLRKASINRMALHAAQALAPAGMQIDIADISEIPLYNEDVHAAGLPPSVQAFRAAIKAADALLIVSPEYNFSIPGVLKNAIDWASRPPEQPFDGKPTAIMGASPGQVGTARMQYHLRQTLLFLNTQTVVKPEVFINMASGKFNAQGELTDEGTKKVIADLLLSLEKTALRPR